MRVIVTGGRGYCDVVRIWSVLDWLDAPDGRIRLVIEGASDDVTGPYTGADYWAHQWALARNKPTCRAHANWIEEGRAAGPIRNSKMLAEQNPDVVLHFPGGSGTNDMVRKARAAGVRVIDGGRKASQTRPADAGEDRSISGRTTTKPQEQTS